MCVRLGGRAVWWPGWAGGGGMWDGGKGTRSGRKEIKIWHKIKREKNSDKRKKCRTKTKRKSQLADSFSAECAVLPPLPPPSLPPPHPHTDLGLNLAGHNAIQRVTEWARSKRSLKCGNKSRPTVYGGENSKGATPYSQSPRGNRGGGGETIWGFEVMFEYLWKHGTELATLYPQHDV